MNNYKIITPSLLLAGTLLALSTGCDRNARLADHQIRHPVAKTVTHYGKTLNEGATPAEVAYVLLRAIQDDFTAAKDEDRQKALDIQFDLCAGDSIDSKQHTSLTRDEFLYEVVYRWTPTVAHYVGDVETDWDKAKARLITASMRPASGAAVDAMEIDVFMKLADPSGDPNASVVLQIGLIQEKGFWRVMKIGFDSSRRETTPRASHPHAHEVPLDSAPQPSTEPHEHEHETPATP